jgi:hypothetical protein
MPRLSERVPATPMSPTNKASTLKRLDQRVHAEQVGPAGGEQRSEVEDVVDMKLFYTTFQICVPLQSE